MATEVIAGGIGEVRSLSASGGTPLSTTPAYVPIIRNTTHLFITPRKFLGADVVKFALNPYLSILETANRMGAVTPYSDQAQGGSGVVTLSSLDTLANGDWLLVGAHLPFRGVYVGMTAGVVNGNASVLSVAYWKDQWANASATDGTASGGATFAQNGLVYWAVPADWKALKLSEIYSGAYATNGTGAFTGSPIDLKPGRNIVTCTGAGTLVVTLPAGATGSARSGTATMTTGNGLKALDAASDTTLTLSDTGTILIDINAGPVNQAPIFNTPLFWTRWAVSAALDSSTTADAMLCANRSTAYGELVEGQAFETKCHIGATGIGCVEALTNTGTANLIIDGATNYGSGF